jgi:hypothetical protein
MCSGKEFCSPNPQTTGAGAQTPEEQEEDQEEQGEEAREQE